MNVAGALLVCDLDGTLLDSRHEISEKNRQAIWRFVENGGMFTIATGRMEASVKPIADALRLTLPAILYNGASIYHFERRQVVWSQSLPEVAADIVGEVALHFPGVGIEIYVDGQPYFYRENVQTRQHQIKEGMNPRYGHPAPHGERMSWQKVLIAWSQERLVEVEAFLRERQVPLHLVRSEPHFLEVLPPGVNKGTALEKLLHYMDFRPTVVVAMGDHFNDAELLQYADIGVAVDNAHDQVKRFANRIGVHHDQHAVAEVIEWLERMNREEQLFTR
ncbi:MULTISPECIES: Cof-type HAD-IIB family hydrolase [Brevibacillus]|uniref:Cof-type HAD-IIB family hydrolase n=1 Tax=Brevibacillus TaxID=55080 RepID=UPI00286B59A4|nr:MULTISPECIES: Cof-type HAD-IIB family hydrolase [Brevibacillus]MED1953116.1 Cof-type HAD-IIB family hydrolase [Brevibacillus centrosporus]